MSFTPLIQALSQGAVVITPTNRLQRDILWLYNQSSGSTVTPKPKCFTYGNWLKNWYETFFFQNPHENLPKLINDWQFQLLWKSHSQKPLKHFEMQQIMSVIKNCALCLSPPKGSDFLYTPIAQEFQSTWIKVQDRLKQNNWLPTHQLASFLSSLPYHEAPEIIWACFDYLHPEQQLIYQHLQELNIKQSFYDLNTKKACDTPEQAIEQLLQVPKTTECFLLKAEDDQIEYQQLIQWIKNLWTQGTRRIGVVIPDLSQQINHIRRMFKQHLPCKHLHFSLGQALTDFPIVKHGLALLKLDINQRLTRHQCRLLLHSPFIQLKHEEQEARFKIYQLNSVLQEPELTFSDFISACQKSCPKWSEQLQKIQALPEKATISDWIKHIHQRWQAFGFPGYQTLDENNRQILDKFYNTVMQLYDAQAIVSEFSQTELLSELTKLCQEQIHQPPQNYYGIHIMGWLESSGFSGQAVWICHLQSQLLPQAVQYSPMLPLAWQKQQQFPRTNNAKEYQLAKQMLYRLINGQNQVVLSYAELKQQQVQWPSPILPDKLKSFTPEYIEVLRPSLETVTDEFQVPFQEQIKLGHGTSLISYHAQCPFKAFAKYRLKTEQTVKEQFGLGPLEQGQIIHEILHKLWLKLKNQDTLVSLTEEALKQLILETINEHLISFTHTKPYSLNSISKELEIELLMEKITRVLELDKNRPSFKIDALEQKQTLNLMNHTFEMRFDRVDELADGKKIVIDYKLNVPSPLPWLQNRPFHPQMLMYALANENLEALAFFPINDSKQDKAYKMTGYGAEKWDIDGITASKLPWPEVRQQWKKSIETYIEEIQRGYCQPTPSNNACRNCNHHDLCRVQLAIEPDA